MKPLVITEAALDILMSSGFPIQILTKDDPVAAQRFILVQSEHGKFLVAQGDTSTRALVIRRWVGGLFDGVKEIERRPVFDRCVRIALHSFDEGVGLNPRWMAYHEGNRISVFAFGYGHGERIVADVNAANTGSVFIFDFGVGPRIRDLKGLTPDYDEFQNALDELPEILEKIETESRQIEGQVDLGDKSLGANSIAKGFSYSDWYARLSERQREFVDFDLSGPLRLRGAAGTGKTLAMVMKALKLTYDAREQQRECRILFLTHSWPMAEQIDMLLSDIDRTGLAANIDVYPLLTVSQRRDYQAVGRHPLGLDSDEGKRKALKEIGEIIDQFVSSDWLAYKRECSTEFVSLMDANAGSVERRRFAWDILVEFGCVIAANGLLGHDGDRARYLRIKRMKWMMPLQTIAEREVIFSLWKAFLEQLQRKQLISSDQIVADALNELSTFYWEAARVVRGYDVILVDEMHLFNAQERLIFHHLLADANVAPRVVMALDPKQSPREVFTEVVDERDTETSSIFDKARLPNPTKIDLVDVYRYTPQIARLVRSVLSSVPALDLTDEWNVVLADSSLDAGPCPELVVVDNATGAFKAAISIARSLRKESRARGGRVAILCLDDDRFAAYQVATAQYPEDVILIASRDEVDNLRYSKTKIVFSTPEYVAGLQFDTVIVLDANRSCVPESNYNGHQVRRFLSELYVGISRAEVRLVIIASRDAGGPSQFIKKAVDEGMLVSRTEQ